MNTDTNKTDISPTEGSISPVASGGGMGDLPA